MSGSIGFQVSPGGSGGGLPSAQNADGALVAVAAADTSKAITFAVPYTQKPAVVAKLLSPTGGTEIVPRIDYSTLTNTGVTFRFSAIPASGWFLAWESVGT